MDKARFGRIAAPALFAVAAVVAGLGADANFADSAGFSGRAGATCISCHTLAPAPLTPPPATAVLEGLPAAWTVGGRYDLSIRVEGGPEALPPPQPQGGFDLAVSAGTLEIPPDFTDLLRNPNSEEVTYQPAGTLMRAWKTTWVAPDLAQRPAPVTVWLAVLAANGNHVIAANASDGGERFDSTASLILTVAPSPEAEAAWRALPLRVPATNARVDGKTGIVDGTHADANATGVRWRIDTGDWQERSTGPDWQLRFPGLEPGTHKVFVQSTGADRASDEVRLTLDVPGFFSGGKDAPAPSFVVLLAILGLAAVARWRAR